MKVLLQSHARLKMSLLQLTCFALLIFFAGCKKGHENPTLTISTVASGLVNPMGVEADRWGNVWVIEAGTAHNDAKVIVIKPNGNKYDAIVNLSSIINENSGEIQGGGHLLLDNGMLYVLSGNYLYKVNVSGFKPGDKPIDGSTLSFEDIAAFSMSYPWVNNAHDSHPYNLMKGPDGDIYICDAGANAIIHRKSAGHYSVLAELPGVANPTPVGPPQVQAVPTGIIFDGHNFLVTTLTGFPFPEGQAVIYKVSPHGNVSIYQQGLTTLVDIADGNMYGHMVLHYASFGAMGFAANTGSLTLVNGSSATVLAGNLNMPVGIKQVNDHTWYITVMGDGTVIKATYN
ncbi:MAG: ScyD/ScyE family protein [Bacteroidota bacterium]|nr:ScyD/ScyE family protein [Bacteroidota bacterium]